LRRIRLDVKAAGKVIVLPDFFIDRFVRIKVNPDKFWEEVKKRINVGGGRIDGTIQSIVKGGNAVNMAYCLGRLGVKTELISVGDWISRLIINNLFSKLSNVNVKIIDGKPGLTVALEFSYNDKVVNVMVRDRGDVENFSSDKLSKEDWEKIKSCRIAVVVNWAANEKCTQLAKDVFEFSKKHGIMTYFDPADIEVRIYDFPNLLKDVFKEGLIDVLSVNENEARTIAKQIGVEPLPINFTKDDVDKSCRLLSNRLNLRVDFHTTLATSTYYNNDGVTIPTFKVKQLVATGAGDVWDAGDILGYLAKLSDEDRLILANACGAIYVSSLEVPDLERTLRFIESAEIKS
jgi:ribokinase